MGDEVSWREAVLDHLLEGSPTSVVVLRELDDGADAMIVLIDAGTAALLGRSVEDLGGLQLADNYPERPAQEVLHHLRIAREHGRTSFEASRDLPSGRQTARVELRRLDDEHYLLLGSDLTGQRQAERRLRRIEQLAGVGSYHWNVATDEIVWSEGIYRLFGLEPATGNVPLERFVALIHPEDREEQGRLIGLVRETGAPVSTTFRSTKPSGERIIVEVRAEAVPDDDGTLQYVVGTIQDVTERLRYERQAEEIRRTDARRQTALQVHDRIVQGLSTAWLALELGEVDQARTAIRRTTANAQEVVQELLTDLAGADGIHAGDLASSTPRPADGDAEPPGGDTAVGR